MPSVEFSIPYPPSKEGKKIWAKEYSLNAYYSGKHWSKRKKDADYWHSLTSFYARNIKTKFTEPVTISYLFDDNLDISNHAAICKMIEDAIVRRGIIPNDTQKWVRGMFIGVNNKEQITVIIAPVRENKCTEGQKYDK